MEPSDLIDKLIIHAMTSNKKEKLIDLLHMTCPAIYRLRGVENQEQTGKVWIRFYMSSDLTI